MSDFQHAMPAKRNNHANAERGCFAKRQLFPKTYFFEPSLEGREAEQSVVKFEKQ